MERKVNAVFEFEDDILDRKKFSEMLLERIVSLKNNKSSYVIGLYGGWGSGKSSIINLMLKCMDDEYWIDFKERNNITTFENEIYGTKDYLKSFNIFKKPLEFFYTPPIQKKSDKPIVVNFSPWNYSKEDSLISNFFRQLSSVIIESDIKRSLNILPVLKKYSELIGFAIPYANPIIELLCNIESEDSSKSEDLSKVKNELIKNLSVLKNKIIVVIDDIDRLSKEEIVEVFKLVKSVADFPNVVYVLAFDLDIVAKALSDIQGPVFDNYILSGKSNILPGVSISAKSPVMGNLDINMGILKDSENGYKYIEKIVQMPFEIPKIDKNNIFELLDHGIFEITGRHPVTFKTYYEMYRRGFKNFFKNLRDVYRYLNVLKFNWTKIMNSVDFVEYLGILAIQVFKIGRAHV